MAHTNENRRAGDAAAQALRSAWEQERAENSQERHEPQTVNLGLLLLNCRSHICETYFHDGAQPALAALAECALILAQHIDEDGLHPHLAWDTLQEVAENLRLVEHFGNDAVTEALASGPRVYAAYVASEESSFAADTAEQTDNLSVSFAADTATRLGERAAA